MLLKNFKPFGQYILVSAKVRKNKNGIILKDKPEELSEAYFTVEEIGSETNYDPNSFIIEKGQHFRIVDKIQLLSFADCPERVFMLITREDIIAIITPSLEELEEIRKEKL